MAIRTVYGLNGRPERTMTIKELLTLENGRLIAGCLQAGRIQRGNMIKNIPNCLSDEELIKLQDEVVIVTDDGDRWFCLFDKPVEQICKILNRPMLVIEEER